VKKKIYIAGTFCPLGEGGEIELQKLNKSTNEE